MRKRFLGHAGDVTGLDHPCIETVLDLGQDGDLLYAASEVIEGETLLDRVQSAGPLAAANAARVAHALALALGAAHAAGVVHGAVSAESVVLALDRGAGGLGGGATPGFPAGAPILTGFFFSLLLAEAGGLHASWLAPEIGQGEPAEPRSDIFGLGTVLHLMLTGNPLPGDAVPGSRGGEPLRGAPAPRGAGGTASASFSGAPGFEADASERGRTDVRSTLERIALRALARSPAQRYQSAEEMAGDLERIIPPEQRATARAPGTPETSDAAAGAARSVRPPGLTGEPGAHAHDAPWMDEPTIPLAVPELDRRLSPRRGAAAEESSGGTPPGAGPAGEAPRDASSIGAIPIGQITHPPAPAGRHEPAGPSAPGRHSPKAPGRHRTATLLAAGSLLIVAVIAIAFGIGLVLRSRRPSASAAGRHDSVAVLPLQVLGLDPESSQHLAAGLSRQMVAALSRSSRLRVTPWATSRRYSERRQSVPEIGRALNVDAIVTGTLRRRESAIEAGVSLIDARTGASLWSATFEEPPSGLVTLQQRVSAALAARLAPAGGGGAGGAPDAAPPISANADAYEAYLTGQAIVEGGKAPEDSALPSYEKALELDPRMTSSYVGIGLVRLHRARREDADMRSELKAAEAVFRKALELDPANVAALKGLIGIDELREETEKCLETGRMVPRGLETIETLTARAAAYLCGGLCDRAPDLLNRAIALDPQNQEARLLLVQALAWSGRYQQAVEAGEAYLKSFPDAPEIRQAMGEALWSLGELNRARAEYGALARQTPEDPLRQRLADQGRLEKALGDPEQARRIWEGATATLKRHLVSARRSATARFQLAEIFALLGSADLFEQELAGARQAQGGPRPDDPPEVIGAWLALDEKDQALEGLHRRLAAGHLGQYWFNVERLRERDLQNMTGFTRLTQEYGKRQQRLEETY
jgi:TolB-like protein/tetratricopeptide (TPR) repeat protein